MNYRQADNPYVDFFFQQRPGLRRRGHIPHLYFNSRIGPPKSQERLRQNLGRRRDSEADSERSGPSFRRLADSIQRFLRIAKQAFGQGDEHAASLRQNDFSARPFKERSSRL